MSRQSLDKKSAEKSYLNFLDDCNAKSTLRWDSNSSNEEPFADSKSEVLWSRENNDMFFQNDFFQGIQDGFSDLTEGSASSCSWHNDDFDMNSSNKVQASLEAIEDALYEQQQSPLINKAVFQECCDWSNKFPYFRLKGTQIIKPNDDGVVLYSSPHQYFTPISESSSLSLQVEGKKMSLHAPEKSFKKTNFDRTSNFLNETPDSFEDTLDDDEYEECLTLDTGRDTCNKMLHSKFIEEESLNVSSIKLLEDKVIERIALEIWPKVMNLLQKVTDTHIHDTNEDFQLPPIVSAVGQRQVLRRPRTEGTDVPTPDFPRLNSLLSISPKVLQNKREYGSWRATQRQRPNSEIQLHRRNYSVPSLKGKHEQSKVMPLQTNAKQAQLPNSNMTIKEDKEHESLSLFLPAVNEDVPESTDILKEFYLDSEIKEATSITHDIASLKKSECFLPPIGRKDYVPSNVKLTRNLFTFFGSQMKCDKLEGELPMNRPISRPNTSSSRKASKYSGNMKHKRLNDGHSSLSHSNPREAKKLNEVNLEKPVTLFPIVTSLLPNKERNSSGVKKGLLNTFGGGRKR